MKSTFPPDSLELTDETPDARVAPRRAEGSGHLTSEPTVREATENQQPRVREASRSEPPRRERVRRVRRDRPRLDSEEIDLGIAVPPLTGNPVRVRRVFPTSHVDDDALKVLKRLHRHGHQAYLVGGCVRDLLLNRTPKDFDVATSARPHEVRNLFRNCRIIGRRFRLAHILFGPDKVIETATFRKEPKREERDEDEVDVGDGPISDDVLIRNDNVFGEPHEDARRRDFTINGLFYDVQSSEVIDFVGGLRDVESRVINTIGVPELRFREDPVRMLRAIKFSARLDLGIDPAVHDALVAQRDELKKAAPARVFEEVLRLLRGGAARRSYWLLWETGVLSVILPALSAYLDDQPKGRSLLWSRLSRLDERNDKKRGPLSDAVLFSLLMMEVVEEALFQSKEPHEAFEDLFASLPVAPPRKLKERLKILTLAQRRIRNGRADSIRQREFYNEACALYELMGGTENPGGQPLRRPRPPAK